MTGFNQPSTFLMQFRREAQRKVREHLTLTTASKPVPMVCSCTFTDRVFENEDLNHLGGYGSEVSSENVESQRQNTPRNYKHK